jgi:hypothetical protein
MRSTIRAVDAPVVYGKVDSRQVRFDQGRSPLARDDDFA